ncbi:hypothetical protein IQ273_02960 [Nodosilinea sp. LEGE 07298]|uniref:hypothetical protein n=1 Tax=Nodosilinea sp. LEGE 07298 TaxID=2777970 RepID=UPI00187F9202|nr:hypothetical protein [Nodosilinea sp. LEGE 07298]MBE9108380.1 hypothetical protein [Nodosilinea sp. LEGE 07298]
MPQAPRQGQARAIRFDNAALITQDFYTNKPQHGLFIDPSCVKTLTQLWCDGPILTGHE